MNSRGAAVTSPFVDSISSPLPKFAGANPATVCAQHLQTAPYNHTDNGMYDSIEAEAKIAF